PPATLSPSGGEGRGEGGRFMESLDLQLWTRVGTMNRCASQRRAPDRGSATRSRFMESLPGFPTRIEGHERWGETPSSPNSLSLGGIRARRSLAPPGSWGG